MQYFQTAQAYFATIMICARKMFVKLTPVS